MTACNLRDYGRYLTYYPSNFFRSSLHNMIERKEDSGEQGLLGKVSETNKGRNRLRGSAEMWAVGGVF